ncbi:unnamed protein product, partial [Hapterophycus canaliculatus]
GRKLGWSREQASLTSDTHAPSDTSNAAYGPQVQLRRGSVHRSPLYLGGA